MVSNTLWPFNRREFIVRALAFTAITVFLAEETESCESDGVWDKAIKEGKKNYPDD